MLESHANSRRGLLFMPRKDCFPFISTQAYLLESFPRHKILIVNVPSNDFSSTYRRHMHRYDTFCDIPLTPKTVSFMLTGSQSLHVPGTSNHWQPLISLSLQSCLFLDISHPQTILQVTVGHTKILRMYF